MTDPKIIFNEVRDLPYHCPENQEDKDYRCWGKNRILFNKLKKEGYEVRFRVCKFLWKKQRFPEQISSKSPGKSDNHLFLEINLDNEWIILDCSNDSKLPSYNKWDGKSNCEIEVLYEKIYTPEESSRLEREEAENFPKKFKEYQEFYKSINRFLDKIRK